MNYFWNCRKYVIKGPLNVISIMKKAIVNKSTSIIKTTNDYFLPIYNVYSLNSKRRWCLQREIHAPVWASHTVWRCLTSKWDHNIPLLITGSGNMVFLNLHIKSKRQWRKIKNKTLGQNVITLLFTTGMLLYDVCPVQ